MTRITRNNIKQHIQISLLHQTAFLKILEAALPSHHPHIRPHLTHAAAVSLSSLLFRIDFPLLPYG